LSPEYDIYVDAVDVDVDMLMLYCTMSDGDKLLAFKFHCVFD